LSFSCAWHCPSDARWFAQRLGALLQVRLRDVSLDIAEVLHQVTAELSAEYTRYLSNAKPDPLAAPSASLSIFRLRGEVIELFQLGDCLSIVTEINGRIETFLDDAVSKLDNAVIQHVLDVSRRKNISFSEALVYGQDMLIQNRNKRNTPDGYWVLDLSGVGIQHAVTRRFPTDEIHSLAVMSDGFAEIVSLYKLYDHQSLMKRMEECSLESLCDELFKVQAQDLTMEKYPRLKFRDDASAAWCRVM
ncbi:MAG: protein phosphatase 2C domain-containing protein, partial [Limnochordia bacterium]